MIEIRINTSIDTNNKIGCQNHFNIQLPFSIEECKICLRELEICTSTVKDIFDKCQELGIEEAN